MSMKKSAAPNEKESCRDCECPCHCEDPYDRTIPIKKPKEWITFIGPFTMHDLGTCWGIESPMGTIFLDGMTRAEAHYVGYALNKAYPPKKSKKKAVKSK